MASCNTARRSPAYMQHTGTCTPGNDTGNRSDTMDSNNDKDMDHIS